MTQFDQTLQSLRSPVTTARAGVMAWEPKRKNNFKAFEIAIAMLGAIASLSSAIVLPLVDAFALLILGVPTMIVTVRRVFWSETPIFFGLTYGIVASTFAAATYVKEDYTFALAGMVVAAFGGIKSGSPSFKMTPDRKLLQFTGVAVALSGASIAIGIAIALLPLTEFATLIGGIMILGATATRTSWLLHVIYGGFCGLFAVFALREDNGYYPLLGMFVATYIAMEVWRKMTTK